MSFLVSKHAREKYKVSVRVFPYDFAGSVFDTREIQGLAHHLSAERFLLAQNEKPVKAGELNAISLIDEIFRLVIKEYQKQNSSPVLAAFYSDLEKGLGEQTLKELVRNYCLAYKPREGLQSKTELDRFLNESTRGVANQEIVLENLVLLYIATQNPALQPFTELIWEPSLVNAETFKRFSRISEDFFARQPSFAPGQYTLINMLKSPALFAPYSIPRQLEYIKEQWAFLLGDLLLRLLRGLDFLKEEEKTGFTGPGPAQVPVFDASDFLSLEANGAEFAAFSKDSDWMPRLVLMAKNVYVWLHQLSRQYNRPIQTLDQIPEEELETLSRRGISGLWLIGLWQRSPASAKIKQLCGNPDANSSAYSLFAYRIADNLGGDGACENLKQKAQRFGIRLASDMVPNHMGIDSEWVNRHPDWFLSLPDSPYPSYQFSGPDLSSDENITIQIEDHYYDRSDAAVVFRRWDKRSGDVKYIYHGNDGTSMPWNDTAQLNYLDAEVREAIIQTILDVARRFPIIRFDAAMTLAKKHIQRLWYPEPGAGGAIPSRSFFAISKAEFEQALPKEFWREVVERVEKEVPDTLLLAEAFWLMEGYFVRSLGMHRVYNSAFMHMLRNEDNAGYRTLIKNTLDFDPQILKRYVNFMNNPDERTAIDQFGNGDKYFGVCTLMATLPGLPMYGHGQFEGFTEKYGMEYSRALLEENVDDSLMRRHELEIFPLLFRREMFAGVENFNLYDFITSQGETNENVFAYTNQILNHKTLVIYNNAYEKASGRITQAYQYASTKNPAEKRSISSILQFLELPENGQGYLRFHDLSTRMHYLRPVQEIRREGFSFELNGFEHHVFTDFRVVHADPIHDYDELYKVVGHTGVPDLDQVLERIRLSPVLTPLQSIINEEFLGILHKAAKKPSFKVSGKLVDQLEEKINHFIQAVKWLSRCQSSTGPLVEELCRLMQFLIQLPSLEKTFAGAGFTRVGNFLARINQEVLEQPADWKVLVSWVVVSKLGKLVNLKDYAETSVVWLDEWDLAHPLVEELRRMHVAEDKVSEYKALLKIATLHQCWFREYGEEAVEDILQRWVNTPEIHAYLKINLYEGKAWYKKESFSKLILWMETMTILDSAEEKNANLVNLAEKISTLEDLTTKIKELDANSEYQVDVLLKNARGLNQP